MFQSTSKNSRDNHPTCISRQYLKPGVYGDGLCTWVNSPYINSLDYININQSLTFKNQQKYQSSIVTHRI